VIYYFDLKDRATVRYRTGLEFPTTHGAIEHSKELVRRLRGDPRLPNDPDLSISVIDESGAEIHQEKVYGAQAIPELEIQTWKRSLTEAAPFSALSLFSRDVLHQPGQGPLSGLLGRKLSLICAW
jgi:hypothetical protein